MCPEAPTLTAPGEGSCSSARPSSVLAVCCSEVTSRGRRRWMILVVRWPSEGATWGRRGGHPNQNDRVGTNLTGFLLRRRRSLSNQGTGLAGVDVGEASSLDCRSVALRNRTSAILRLATSAAFLLDFRTPELLHYDN